MKKTGWLSLWKGLGILTASIFIVLVMFTLYAASIVTRLAADAEALKRMAQSGMFALAPRGGPFEQRLTQTGEDLREVRMSLGGLVAMTPYLGWIPRWGGDLANVPALLDFSEQAIAGAKESIAIVHAIQDEMQKGSVSDTPLGVSLLFASQDQAGAIMQARMRLEKITQTRRRINAAQLSPKLEAWVDQFDRLLPWWQGGLDTLAFAPQLLGGARPRSYLLLLQNSDELRATGGFISGVALLRVDRGQLALTDFRDSYAVGDLTRVHPTAPEALRKYMETEILLLRDANWSPDFPEVARLTENLYSMDRGVETDGVIGVNLNLLPRILAALGPVNDPSNNERVDASNVIAKIQEAWSAQSREKSEDWWAHRKDFIGNLLAAIVAQLRAGDFEGEPMARAMYQAINAKDLLIYLNDLDVTQETLPWSGALYRGAGDALMIVDSNVGFNKVNVNIERLAKYQVTLNAMGGGTARVTVTYTNQSRATNQACIHRPVYLENYADLQRGCYWNYVRVIAPAGSRLLSANGLLETNTEPPAGGRATFGGYFVLGRGESRTIQFEYALPTLFKRGAAYSLHLEKQPGSNPIPMVVEINFPPGWSALSSDKSTLVTTLTLEHDISLPRDQTTEISFRSP